MEKLKDRYKGTDYLKDKDIIEMDRGSKEIILPKERHRIRTNPGPDNKETWRGKEG